MTVREAGAGWQLAECLLPGLTLATAEALERRLQVEIAGRPASEVRLVGSVLMPEDEVLLVLFRGSQDAVRAVSERAGLPFDRIVCCVGIGWLPSAR